MEPFGNNLSLSHIFIRLVCFCLVQLSYLGSTNILLSKIDFEDKTKSSIYIRNIGERTYTTNKLDRVNWPDAFHTCKSVGASLVHFDTKEELNSIRQLITDPELADVEEFWSAAVFDKSSKKPGFINMNKNDELNFFEFLRGDSRCVSISTKSGYDNSTIIDLNYSFCMRQKAFVCQSNKVLTVDVDEGALLESDGNSTNTGYYEKEINGWNYSMNMTQYMTWLEAFENCKHRGANLVTAGKFDVQSAWILSKDPKLKAVGRFWSAGVLDPKGERTWLGHSTNLIDHPGILHALQQNKLNCIHHVTVSKSASLYDAFPSVSTEDATNLPLNYSLCSVKMLFLCEEPTYQILRTDSSEVPSDINTHLRLSPNIDF